MRSIKTVCDFSVCISKLGPTNPNDHPFYEKWRPKLRLCLRLLKLLRTHMRLVTRHGVKLVNNKTMLLFCNLKEQKTLNEMKVQKMFVFMSMKYDRV